jgi:hypothetical protein
MSNAIENTKAAARLQAAEDRHAKNVAHRQAVRARRGTVVAATVVAPLGQIERRIVAVVNETLDRAGDNIALAKNLAADGRIWTKVMDDCGWHSYRCFMKATISRWFESHGVTGVAL